MSLKRLGRTGIGAALIIFSICSAVGAKTVITYFYWASSTELKLRQQMVTMFEKANPGISVKQVWCDPSVFDTKLIAMTAAGMAPDVVNMCNDWHGKRNPLWMPLDSFIQKDKNWKKTDFYPVTINSLAQKGKQYAVPYIVKSAVFFYNATLMNQLGFSIPTDSWNWDNMQTIAMKGSNSASGNQKKYGLGGLGDVHAAWAFGGELFISDMTKCIANNELVAKGLNFAVDLIHKYQVMPRYGDIGRFTGAKSPIAQGYSWDIMGMQKNIKAKFNWDIVGLPSDEKGHRSADVRVDGLAMIKSAKNKDACWRFMKFMSADRAVQEFVGAQEGIPALKAAANSDSFFNSFPTGQSYNRRILANALNYGKVQPFGGYFAPISDVWGKEIGAALDNKKSVDEALKKFEQQSNVILTTPGRLH